MIDSADFQLQSIENQFPIKDHEIYKMYVDSLKNRRAVPKKCNPPCEHCRGEF